MLSVWATHRTRRKLPLFCMSSLTVLIMNTLIFLFIFSFILLKYPVILIPVFLAVFFVCWAHHVFRHGINLFCGMPFYVYAKTLYTLACLKLQPKKKACSQTVFQNCTLLFYLNHPRFCL